MNHGVHENTLQQFPGSDCDSLKRARRDGRVAEGARLESVYTARYPGFESLSLRHTFLIHLKINDLDSISATCFVQSAPAHYPNVEFVRIS